MSESRKHKKPSDRKTAGIPFDQRIPAAPFIMSTHFLVAGATGRQGSAVVKALLSRTIPPSNIYAITRSPESSASVSLSSKGVNIVSGDLNNPSALLAQVPQSILPTLAIFLAQAHGPTEVTDAKGLIDTASSLSISHFVYSSVDRGGLTLSDSDPSYCKTFSDKFLIENHLKSSSLSYTILRPTWFVDNAHWGFPGKLCMTGWRDWMKGKTMQVVTTADIGKWGAEALIQPDHFGIRNTSLSIASDYLSYSEFDAIFKAKMGHSIPVMYSWPALGMIWIIKDVNTMFRFINERDYGADIEWLGKRIEPMTVKDWVETIV